MTLRLYHNSGLL